MNFRSLSPSHDKWEPVLPVAKMSHTFIIAIDFGTSFSGYAYSLSPTSAKTEPHVKLWNKTLIQKTPKTPTCILLDQHGEVMAFGYEARNKYYEIRKDTAKYYYFKDFKMSLYGKVRSIKDVNKKSMSALKVFSAALSFLKEDALKTIRQNTLQRVNYIASDFTWVLTVPAIWDISARQFMREAAVQAGLVSSFTEDTLVIALEPEAASVWCKQLEPKDFIKDSGDKVKLSVGAQYVVLDCGGGTIDITVHEVLEGGALKELHKPLGEDKGGRIVDRKFIHCLRKFFCDGLWEEYEREHPKEAQEFMEDFSYLKQAPQNQVYKLKVHSKFKLKIEKREKAGAGESPLFKSMEGVSWDSGNIKISEEKMKSFFHETLVHITDSLTGILQEHKGISYILLVGGLSSSHILREHVQREFSDRAKVMCPKNPQEVILRGAVMFGRDPSVIRSRKSAFTYGFVKMQRFDPSKHKPEKKFTNEDGDWCDDLFGKMVEADEDVEWNETRKFDFTSTDRDQTVMSLEFYRTERKNVRYVDDWGVEGPVAHCDLDMPDISKGLDRKVKLEVFFGSTEINAVATDLESQSTASVKMDFIKSERMWAEMSWAQCGLRRGGCGRKTFDTRQGMFIYTAHFEHKATQCAYKRLKGQIPAL
uniref:Heat shock 70 kDa protein 12A n=1 Tax=Neogobius melanostomus TaxID=47308 RepID=A0A8C6UPI7_9GOBI